MPARRIPALAMLCPEVVMRLEPEFLEPDQSIPQRMPLLDLYLAQHQGETPFAGVTALFLQHQFGNQVPQARAMIELGLDPEKLLWIDIPYTSNARVREALVELGIPRRNLVVSTDYWMLDRYAPYQRKRVQEAVRDYLDTPPKQLLVLDDGAYFLEAACCFQRRLPSVALVEQTERGFIKLEAQASTRAYAEGVRTIDVARSAPKKVLESPFIGRAVCASLLRRLKGWDVAEKKHCLVLGFGAIGEEVARFLVEYLGYQAKCISIFDPDDARRQRAAAEGYSVWDRKDLRHRFHLVIGCSGRASFHVYDYVYLEDGAVLASASSGSVELSREDFIELADGSRIDDIEIERQGLSEQNIHSDIRMKLVDRHATFLNGGFPVNFDGHVNCVPMRHIQPTVTMMTAAAVQAVSGKDKGVVPLDPAFCDWLFREFRRELGDEAEVLFPSLGAAAGGTL